MSFCFHIGEKNILGVAVGDAERSTTRGDQSEEKKSGNRERGSYNLRRIFQQAEKEEQERLKAARKSEREMKRKQPKPLKRPAKKKRLDVIMKMYQFQTLRLT